MDNRTPVFVLVLMLLVAFSQAVAAQQQSGDDPQTRSADSSPKEGQSAADDQAEASESEPDEDLEEDEEGLEDEETEEDEQGQEEKAAELTPPKNLDLDMSALGEMDPEKELLGQEALTEDKAAAQATEDWTERELDLLEIHGYFRVRPELYHKFYMRHTDDTLFSRPAVKQQPEEDIGVNFCGEGKEEGGCDNATLTGANMRLRLEPTLNISEEVWVKTQIDFLDNIMLGSTPRYWQNYSDANATTIESGRIQGWHMGPPSTSDMIVVRRAWGEVMTPLGQLRFGRMGDHWGLGMLHNAGGGIEQDYGDTVDRIMFAAKINDWLIAPAFDFPNEGFSGKDAAGYPFDVSQLDDSYQLVGIVAYKHDAEKQLAMLKRGDWLVNTGLYFTYRWQVLSFEDQEGSVQDPDVKDGVNEFYKRDMWAITPDLWFQFLYDTFHLEIEAALIYGEVGNPDKDLELFSQSETLRLIQFGAALHADYGILSDQLRFGLKAGFASGDKGVEGLRAPANYDQLNANHADNTFSAFSFNPSYNTDLILYRHILGSVSQTYFLHPWLRYDFLKSKMGKQMGFQIDFIYSRAVWEASTISNNSGNLGIELGAQVMYVSEDHFHAGLRYGVLFPLAGFKGTVNVETVDPVTQDLVTEQLTDTDLTVPQTIQVLLGISY